MQEEITRRYFLGMAARSGLVVSSSGALTSVTACDALTSRPEKPHRYINRSLCIGCGRCVELCPMNAISIREKSDIDPDECAECGVCLRSRVCPAGAIIEGDLGWPRVLRAVFSNPLGKHRTTGVRGRGTEETKCNDSQDRYARGDIGVLVELGRPALGARFRDVERVVRAFRARGYETLRDNPVYDLIRDPATGALMPEVLNEKFISCLVEFIMPERESAVLMEIIGRLAGEVESVFSVSVALRADDNGQPGIKSVFRSGVRTLPWVKVNVGMAQGISGGGI